jgi:hypothetical protein
MAKRGSTKWLSVRQEDHIAYKYQGKRSPSSGGSVTDQGDECKHTGTFDKPAKSISIKLADLDKIADEAWSENREPVMALRIYNPSSILADEDGNVDLIVRLIGDDIRSRYHR